MWSSATITVDAGRPPGTLAGRHPTAYPAGMPSVLATDAYKFAMAEAGFALRTETFYYSHRRGGPHFLPFDAPTEVRKLLPDADDGDALAWLDAHGYGVGGAVRAALAAHDQVEVHALPQGTWFFDREPVFSVTGPSALVSWLEPQILQLHRRIQLATAALLAPATLPDRVACDEEAATMADTLAIVDVPCPALTVDPDGYRAAVRAKVEALVAITRDPCRIFEIGLRTATCPSQHLLALEACADAGVTRTSDFAGARALGLTPVGSMGHEHVQRHGQDDAAFRAMRERFAGPVSYLLDTFSTLDSGIPAALRVLAETGSDDAIRFDSGDKEAQVLYAAARARSMGLSPHLVLEDAFDDVLTARFEELRAFTGITHQSYGYGGYIVRAPWDRFVRDRVAAVYKLCQTGRDATMKFADDASKESLPGRPVLYRPYLGSAGYRGPTGVVAQEGERLEARGPDAPVCLTGCDELPESLRFRPDEAHALARTTQTALSAATQALVSRLRARWMASRRD